jgi:hypothetical protein
MAQGHTPAGSEFATRRQIQRKWRKRERKGKKYVKEQKKERMNWRIYRKRRRFTAHM